MLNNSVMFDFLNSISWQRLGGMCRIPWLSDYGAWRVSQWLSLVSGYCALPLANWMVKCMLDATLEVMIRDLVQGTQSKPTKKDKLLAMQQEAHAVWLGFCIFLWVISQVNQTLQACVWESRWCICEAEVTSRTLHGGQKMQKSRCRTSSNRRLWVSRKVFGRCWRPMLPALHQKRRLKTQQVPRGILDTFRCCLGADEARRAWWSHWGPDRYCLCECSAYRNWSYTQWCCPILSGALLWVVECHSGINRNMKIVCCIQTPAVNCLTHLISCTAKLFLRINHELML